MDDHWGYPHVGGSSSHLPILPVAPPRWSRGWPGPRNPAAWIWLENWKVRIASERTGAIRKIAGKMGVITVE